MARKALIEESTGKVVNVVEFEDGAFNWQPPIGHKLMEAANGSPGDTWDGTKFIPREPTPEQIAEREKAQKQQEVRERAIAAIKANKGGAPWGNILYDLAVAQGLIEPE